MSPEERRTLAEQLKANPLLDVLIDEMEQGAIERLIFEQQNFADAQLRVQAIRAFRSDLMEALDTRTRKGAPA